LKQRKTDVLKIDHQREGQWSAGDPTGREGNTKSGRGQSNDEFEKEKRKAENRVKRGSLYNPCRKDGLCVMPQELGI